MLAANHGRSLANSFLKSLAVRHYEKHGQMGKRTKQEILDRCRRAPQIDAASARHIGGRAAAAMLVTLKTYRKWERAERHRDNVMGVLAF